MQYCNTAMPKQLVIWCEDVSSDSNNVSIEHRLLPSLFPLHILFQLGIKLMKLPSLKVLWDEEKKHKTKVAPRTTFLPLRAEADLPWQPVMHCLL